MAFRPSPAATVVLVALAVLFTALGRWQLERKAEKEQLFDRFRNAPDMEIARALEKSEEFARVSVPGRYDPTRHLLLDNRIWKGRAGVHVLTPFSLADGGMILVDRGWLPLAPDRRALPRFDTDSAPRILHGRLARPPTAGTRLGDADSLSPDHWPQLVTYFDLESADRALEATLLPWIVQLDPGDDSGFEDRNWKPAVMEPAVHGAYALQWFALAATAVALWVVLGIRGGKAKRAA